MAPKPNVGKPPHQPRRYRSDLRKLQAEQTRQRIVAAATDLFAADGYARTTLAKIAAAAGVSAETVQAHGPKAALMVAAMEYATFGVSGEENFLNLEMGRRFLDIADRDEALDYLVSNQTELHDRGADMAQALIGAAASDPELDRYLGELFAGVTLQNRRILTIVRDRGWLRDDLSFDELVGTVAILSGVETFLRVTRRDGWSVARYRKWLRRMIAETVLSPG
ncbi:TetR/AcrR family transcriptional regulator [Mycobacterium sp. EPa45]|uniref:TetR/AcrR family transcriptional regulator n=1 Tax=Mycobacterium sp. EPa45 TaxID=1545728 RepID=UPI00069A1CF2|nr:TetR/AcrR family transcriptional regulator [Mycobacterium sp. EPa45]